MVEGESKENMDWLEPKVLGGTGKWREGKGFSEEEIKKAGLWDLRKDLPYDERRKSCHQTNIELLEEVKERLETGKTELLEERTVKELREMAREKDLSGYSKLRKAELVDLIGENYSEEVIRARAKKT